MTICDLYLEELQIGLRVKSCASNPVYIGTVVYVESGNSFNPYIKILWDDGYKSSASWMHCGCEILEEDEGSRLL